MYQIWLKKWEARKNWTENHKEELLGLAEEEIRLLPPNERRKLRRFRATRRRRDEARAGDLTNLSQPSDEASELSSSQQSLPDVVLSGGSIVGAGESAGHSDLSFSPASATTLNLSWSSEWSSGETPETHQQHPPWRNTIISYNAENGPWNSLPPAGDFWIDDAFMSLELPLRGDPTTCNLSHVLYSTKELVMAHAYTIMQGRNESQRAAFTPLSVMEHFWAQLNNCIYLFKLRDWRRAEPLYRRLRNVTEEIFANITPDFLRRLLAAFCPVNFEVNPVVRKGLLKHFGRLARDFWGETHPFPRLIGQLQLDKSSREVSEKSLSCLRDSVIEHSADIETQQPSVDFEANMAMIALQRRNKDFSVAAHSARVLLSNSRERFGSGSLETRDAAEQLAHIYMDTQNLDEAKTLCRERVGSAVGSDALIGVGYQDKRAMRAMEDLAEIERKLGQPQKCIPWLIAAARCAVDIKRPDTYIVHLVDKVIESSRMCDRHEEGLLWRRNFTYNAWGKTDLHFWEKFDAGLIQC